MLTKAKRESLPCQCLSHYALLLRQLTDRELEIHSNSLQYQNVPSKTGIKKSAKRFAKKIR
jgi:hypothetical protein